MINIRTKWVAHTLNGQQFKWVWAIARSFLTQAQLFLFWKPERLIATTGFCMFVFENSLKNVPMELWATEHDSDQSF